MPCADLLSFADPVRRQVVLPHRIASVVQNSPDGCRSHPPPIHRLHLHTRWRRRAYTNSYILIDRQTRRFDRLGCSIRRTQEGHVITGTKPRQGRILGHYFDRSFAIGLLLTILSLGLFLVSALAKGWLSAITASIGGAALTVAILTFMYEPFLRELFVKEIFDKLEIRDDVAREQLLAIARTPEVDVLQFVGTSTTIRVLPHDPLAWARSEFAQLLNLAKRRPIAIEIFIPAADDPYVSVLSDRLRVGEQEVSNRLNAAALDLGKAWDTEQRHSSASLKVWRYSGVPACGIALCEAGALLEFGPALRYPLADETTYCLQFSDGSRVAEWLTTQLSFSGPEHASLVDQRPLVPTRGKTDQAKEPDGSSATADGEETTSA